MCAAASAPPGGLHSAKKSEKRGMEKKGNKVDFETFHQKHFDLDFVWVVLKYEVFQVTS